MRRRGLVLLIAAALTFGAAGAARAQASAGAQAAPRVAEQPLPAEWEGVWKGMTFIVSADGRREGVPMELHVSAVPGGNARTWRVLYGTGAALTARPYEIMPVAGEPGRFVVDEKNGLFVDNQLVGKVLYSQYLVKTNLVLTRFEQQGDAISVEMTMFDARSPRQSKLTGGNIEVASYKFRSVQHGVLKRAPAAGAPARRVKNRRREEK